MARFYVLIRMKDSSHIEAEFNTKEELRDFFKKHEDNMITSDTIIEDREKSNNQTLGTIAMIALGVLTLFLMFK